MNVNNKRGSITLFLALAMTAVIGVTGIFVHDLMKKKMVNNILRSEDLISESILNTYNQKLYEGFVLLGYDPESSAISKIIEYYEDKHQVDIEYTPIKTLDDRELIRQSKLVVNSMIGLSVVDDMIVKLGLKDDIMSVVQKSKSIISKSEKALKVWDEASEKIADMLDTLIDLKNLYSINDMDDSEINKLGRVISKTSGILRNLRGTVNSADLSEISSGNSNTSYSEEKLSSFDIRDEGISMSTLDGSNLDKELQQLYYQINKFKSFRKMEKDTSDIEATIYNILDNIEFSSFGGYTDSDSDGENMLTKIKDLASKEKSEFEETKQENSIDDDNNRGNDNLPMPTIKRSNVDISLTEKAYMIEYFTIVCSDKVESKTRDNNFIEREEIKEIGKYELEYILTGKTGEAAVTNIKNKIRLIRFAFNSIHLLIDRDKSVTIDAVCTTIFASTGVPPQITKGLITAVWSGIETESDIKIIYQGKGVPLYKVGSESWVTDFDLSSFKSRKVNLNKKNKKSNDEIKSKDEFYYMYYNDYIRLIGMATNYDDMCVRFKTLVYKYVDEENFDMEKLAVEHKIYIIDKNIFGKKEKQVINDGY